MNKNDLVERLRAKPNRPTIKMSLSNGTEIEVPGFSYNMEDDALRKEAADYIEKMDTKSP